MAMTDSTAPCSPAVSRMESRSGIRAVTPSRENRLCRGSEPAKLVRKGRHESDARGFCADRLRWPTLRVARRSSGAFRFGKCMKSARQYHSRCGGLRRRLRRERIQVRLLQRFEQAGRIERGFQIAPSPERIENAFARFVATAFARPPAGFWAPSAFLRGALLPELYGVP